MLIVRGLLRGVFQLLVLACLLFIPAGTWEWPRATRFLSVYGVLLFATIIWLAVAAPSSLEARLEPAISRKQPLADRIATAIIGFTVGTWIVFIPLDLFHWHLLPRPSYGVTVLGAILGLTGFAIMIAAVYQNQFATPVVRHQRERGHRLVDTGLYASVRHPFYTGFLLSLTGLALWLESYASTIGVLAVLASLIVRITVEEITLRERLVGYGEYMERVRYRLIPNLW